jgi:hypothetical protein
MFTVTHPKAGDIDFPDGTSDADIAKAMRQLDAETASNVTAGHGMGDLKIAEQQQYDSPSMPNGQGGYIAKSLGNAAKFVGNVAGTVSTGPINAAAQGFQDEGFTPAGFGKALVSNQIRNLADPFRSGPNRIQSSEKSLERAGVPNQSREIMTGVPGFVMRERARSGSAGLTPADESKYRDDQIYQVPAHENGLAHDLGQAADMFTPAVALSAVKPIAKGVEYGARELAGPVGRGIQKVAVMQAKSAIPINIPFARKGAESETFLKEGLLSGGKNEAYNKASELSKDLGNQVVGIIEQGKNEGKTIDGFALIDNLKAKNTSGAIETKEGIRLLEPASKRVLDKAEKIIKRMSQDGDGRLNVKQANAVKQWLQKQADYPGQALAQGLPLTAEADAAGLTAADLGHEFRTAIESKVPEVKDLNARLSKIIPAKQAAGWKQAVRDRQELVPLKAFVAVIGDLAGGHGLATGLLAMNTAWKSGRISQTMYNLGSKLIKAGNVAEKAKIETAMEKAVSKGMISTDEIEALKAQLEPGKRPFLPSITGPDELAPRSRSGRPALGEQPPTYVPREGSTESPFGPPTPPAQPQFDPLEALDPRNRQSLPEGQGSIEDMAPPEMAQARQQDAQAAREAFVRQDRERQIGKVPLPVEQPLGNPQFRVIDRPIKKPPTQRELFGPSDLSYRRSKMFQYLKQTTGKDPFMSDVYKELEKLGKKDVPKAPEKEILKREFKGRTKPEDHAAMEDLLSNGGQGVETVTIKAEDAPKTFTLGGVEFTKGRTLYGKTIFKGIRDRKFMVSSDGLIHMDKPLDEVPF